MHANTFRRAPLAEDPPRRAPVADSAEPGRRVNATSALLVLLAVLGVVVTFVFGMWMIDFTQPHA